METLRDTGETVISAERAISGVDGWLDGDSARGGELGRAVGREGGGDRPRQGRHAASRASDTLSKTTA